MNPSASGWIDKFGYIVKDYHSLYESFDELYEHLKSTGFIYGINVNIPEFLSTEIQLTEDFLRLEHTDGLNYVNVQLYRFDDISRWFGLYSESFQINLTEGFGAGILYPKTDTTLLGQERHDDYHISGFGLSAGVGLNITFLKHFFIQADLKAGYINMPNVKISTNASDSASQDFFFLQNNILIGGKFRL